MNLPQNPFTRAIAAGKKQIGLWVTLSSNFTAEVVAPSGYDWVLIDMEHSPNDLNSVIGQLQVFASTGTTAIVRPDWNDTVQVKRLLDSGAPGLLFPMIQTVEDAQKAMAAEIGSQDGVSGVFFGPADIAADMGLLGKPMDNAVWDLIMPAARALMAKGIPVGTLVLDTKFAAKLLNEGFTFVACGSDSSILAKGSDLLLAQVKGRLQ